MKLTKDQVKHIAKLANLPVSEEELNTYADQLSEVLDYIAKLNEVDASKLEGIFNVTMRKNITRKDEPGKSLTQEEALANSSSTKDGYFVTKGVFEEE